jgi:hypothetical protein
LIDSLLLHVLLPPLPRCCPFQAAAAQRDAAEAALEADAQSVLGGKDNLADATKDVAGELQDKAAGVYDNAKQRLLGKDKQEL